MREGSFNEWRFWYAENKGTLLAAALFVVMFTIYVSNHPAGFTPNVVQTASNKATLLAFVAMAQCFVVITGGIDLEHRVGWLECAHFGDRELHNPFIAAPGLNGKGKAPFARPADTACRFRRRLHDQCGPGAGASSGLLRRALCDEFMLGSRPAQGVSKALPIREDSSPIQ